MDLPQKLIKYSNLFFGATTSLAAIGQLSYVFQQFGLFLLGLYALALTIPIIWLEFRVPPKLYKYASTYFSFLGRAIIYLLLSAMTMYGSLFNKLNAVLLMLTGLVYLLLHASSIIDEPENFKGQNASIALNDDIDDEEDII